jgi:DNA transposition AAA+ family ATPase
MPHANEQTRPRRMLAAERNTRVLALRRARATQQQIADEVGISRRRVGQILTKAYEALAAEAAAEAPAALAVELDRIDRLILACWGKATNEHHPEQLKAVDRIVRLGEQRQKLLGMYAPETRLHLHGGSIEVTVAEALERGREQVTRLLPA